MTRTVLGVDPGGKTTGWAIVCGRELVETGEIVNDGELLPLDRTYVQQIIRILNLHVTIKHDIDLIAVEGLNRPTFHMKGAALNPTALIATAHVIGAIYAKEWGIEVATVPPDHNGSSVLGAYPETLVSAGERAKPGWQMRVGSGKLRHQRSAFDIAVKAGRGVGV